MIVLFSLQNYSLRIFKDCREHEIFLESIEVSLELLNLNTDKNSILSIGKDIKN